MKKTALISMLVVLAIFISGCSVNEKNTKSNKSETKPITQEKPKEMTKVKFEVSINDQIGNIVIELYNETPQHRDNFIKLVNEKFYDGILFHRVIKNFMIQCGDPDSKTARPNQQLGAGGVGCPFEMVDLPPAICGYPKGGLSCAVPDGGSRDDHAPARALPRAERRADAAVLAKNRDRQGNAANGAQRAAA